MPRYGWRYQIGPWVHRGCRVVAPDMLGYGGSAKPTDAQEYTSKKLCADLSALLDVLGVRRAVRILSPSCLDFINGDSYYRLSSAMIGAHTLPGGLPCGIQIDSLLSLCPSEFIIPLVAALRPLFQVKRALHAPFSGVSTPYRSCETCSESRVSALLQRPKVFT